MEDSKITIFTLLWIDGSFYHQLLGTVASVVKSDLLQISNETTFAETPLCEHNRMLVSHKGITLY